MCTFFFLVCEIKFRVHAVPHSSDFQSQIQHIVRLVAKRYILLPAYVSGEGEHLVQLVSDSNSRSDTGKEHHPCVAFPRKRHQTDIEMIRANLPHPIPETIHSRVRDLAIIRQDFIEMWISLEEWSVCRMDHHGDEGRRER